MHLNGSRAFSYLSVITKNYFIQKVKYNKKKFQTDICLDKTTLTALEKVNDNVIVQPHDNTLEKKEFLNDFFTVGSK